MEIVFNDLQSFTSTSDFVQYMQYIIFIVSFQSSVLHSQPKSTVGTPAYIAPEVLLRQEYDGKVQTYM